MSDSSIPAQEKVVLKGVHGTSIQCATGIKTEGFKSASGRGGTGAYFWRDFRTLGEQLAREWFAFRSSRHGYQGEVSPKCAVIFADIDIDARERIDFERPDIKERLYSLLEAHGYSLYPSDKELGGAHDLLVNELEKKLDYQFKVLEIRVAPPAKSAYPIKALGAPLSYICRRPRQDWIKIKGVKE